MRLADADLLVRLQNQVRHPARPYRIRDIEAYRLDAVGVRGVWELDLLSGYAATIPVWIQAGIGPRAEAELILVAHEDDFVAAVLVYPKVAQEVAEQPTRPELEHLVFPERVGYHLRLAHDEDALPIFLGDLRQVLKRALVREVSQRYELGSVFLDFRRGEVEEGGIETLDLVD